MVGNSFVSLLDAILAPPFSGRALYIFGFIGFSSPLTVSVTGKNHRSVLWLVIAFITQKWQAAKGLTYDFYPLH